MILDLHGEECSAPKELSPASMANASREKVRESDKLPETD